jgi:hypothetical protein
LESVARRTADTKTLKHRPKGVCIWSTLFSCLSAARLEGILAARLVQTAIRSRDVLFCRCRNKKLFTTYSPCLDLGSAGLVRVHHASGKPVAAVGT